MPPPIPLADWLQLVMSLVGTATVSLAHASISINLGLPHMPASDSPWQVTSHIGAATLLLPLQMTGTAAITFAEVITAFDVSAPAIADLGSMLVSSLNLHCVMSAVSLTVCRVFEVGLTGVLMETAQAPSRDGVHTSLADERVHGAGSLSPLVFILQWLCCICDALPFNCIRKAGPL